MQQESKQHSQQGENGGTRAAWDCCPRCDFRLLAVPIIRDVRWYDLRHMCATLHHEAGADPVCVKLALGHSLEGTTEEIYTHPSIEKMRVELSRWSLRRHPEAMLNKR